MSFSTGFPNPGDFIIQSGPQFRANFRSIFDSFAQDHYSIDSANAGMHRSLTLRKQTVDPVTTNNDVALYNKIGTGSVPQLFYAPSNAQTPIQLSYQSIVNTGLQQYSYIAGPFLVYFGQVISTSSNQLVTLSPTSTLISVNLIAGSKESKPPKDPFTLSPIPIISGSGFTIRLQYNPSLIPGLYISYLAIGLVT